MSSMVLQQPLLDSLEQIAASQNTSAEMLLNQAVSEFLEKINREKILLEGQAFQAQHASLNAQYAGQYVAVHHGQVVDYDADARTLHLRIRQQFGRIPILIRLVTDEVEPPDLYSRLMERSQKEVSDGSYHDERIGSV